ncbi:hypothetical protein LTR50_001722 [Elasticomyces elasticus]|nr:hypothetical protein LTR50_001722 [Elasticomyces elasticus]
MFNFTPLLGAQVESPASQSLLELEGGVKILVDVGWDDDFDALKLKPLERHVSTISLILLTHPTVAHLAAFAHCCKHFPLFTKIPVYATTPVISLGRTLLEDLYAFSPLAPSIIPITTLAQSAYSSSRLHQDGSPNILLQPPTPDEIAGYFSLINALKYSQPHQPIPSPFSPPLNGLIITAYNSGHTLGGTIWHIQHGLESVVYAVDWNQAKENLISGAAWLGTNTSGGGGEVIEQLRRPTAMICSSRGAERIAPPGGRKTRDDTLLAMVREAVADGGTVLIPTDSSARVLEIAYLLEQTWRAEVSGPHADTYRNTKVYLAGKSSGATLRYANSMLEWMDEGISRGMEVPNTAGHRNQRQGDQRNGDISANDNSTPLDFRYIKVLSRRSQIDRVLSGDRPRVILASDASLDWGFSQEIIRKISADPKNLVVLTERIHQPSGKQTRKGVGRYLWEYWIGRQGAKDDGHLQNTASVLCSNYEIGIETPEMARLASGDAALYQQYLARQRQLQSTMQTDTTGAMEDTADAVDDASSSTSSSSEDEDTEHQGKALNISATMTHSKRRVGLTDEELGINILLKTLDNGKHVFDYDVRNKKGREKFFPFVAKRARRDEFGDAIRPEEYLRAEERDEVDGQDLRTGNDGVEPTLGQKRKWENAQRAPQDRRMSKTHNKRAKMNGDVALSGRMRNGKNDDREIERDGEASTSEESDYEPEESIVEGPMKVVFKKETLRLNLRIAHVDFTGLHDKRDLQMLIPLIRPRKLILVAGDMSETLALAADCRRLLAVSAGEGGETAVYTPTVGVTVDASVDTNAWTMKLSQRLVKSLMWQNVKGLGIVAVTGRVDVIKGAGDGLAAADESSKKKLKMIEGEDRDTDSPGPGQQPDHAAHAPPDAPPVLDIISDNAAAAGRLNTQPLHVGDLRLADLRKLMQASGYTAEFRGEGTLLVDGIVAVRKRGMGKIEVESCGVAIPGARAKQSEGSFFAVRKKIYEGLAVVAGG